LAIEKEDLHEIGYTDIGRDTTRLILKAADAALASSLPREQVLERLEEMRDNPTSCSDDLLFADAAHRVNQSRQNER